MLAHAQRLRGQKAAAIAAGERALASSKAPKIRFLTARVFAEAGEIARAKTLAAGLASELQAEPQAYAKTLEGMISLENGDPRQAIKSLTEANALLDTWIGRFDLGRAYLEAGLFTQADSEFDRCIKRRGEALALFLDEEPTFGFFPSVYYYQGRVRESLKSVGSVESYRTYLGIRGASREDTLLPEIRKRAGTQGRVEPRQGTLNNRQIRLRASGAIRPTRRSRNTCRSCLAGFTLVSRNSVSGAVTMPILAAWPISDGSPSTRNTSYVATSPTGGAAHRSRTYRAFVPGITSAVREFGAPAPVASAVSRSTPWTALTIITQPVISQSVIAEPIVSQSEVAEAKVSQAIIAQSEVSETVIAQAHVERQRAAESAAHDIASASDLPQVDVRPVVEAREGSISRRGGAEERIRTSIEVDVLRIHAHVGRPVRVPVRSVRPPTWPRC